MIASAKPGSLVGPGNIRSAYFVEQVTVHLQVLLELVVCHVYLSPIVELVLHESAHHIKRGQSPAATKPLQR